MGQTLIEHISFKSVVRFTAPTIIMLVFMSLYQMVDAVFISNFVGSNALSAVNIVYPAISVIIGLSIMLGTGGNAVIARNLGRGQPHLARRQLTLLTLVGTAGGLLILLAGLFFVGDLVRILGATDLLYQYCIDYLLILMFASPLAVLQMLYQSFFPAAGKPHLGLGAVVLGGIANVFFDYLFIVVLGMGVRGAALGTAIGYAIPAVFGTLYFSLKRDGLLYFEKPLWDGRMLLLTCGNGSSEMVTNLASGITTFLFNMVALRYWGEDGVAAVTVILYVQFLLSAAYIGYSSGLAPVISYNYGKQDLTALRKLTDISLLFLGVNAVLWFALSLLFRAPLIDLFVRPDNPVWALLNEGWVLFSLTYLITGFNIYASAMFTAFSDGKTSAIISFLRTFLFLSGSIVGLPYLVGSTGIWLAVPAAELLALCVSVFYFFRKRGIYHYF